MPKLTPYYLTFRSGLHVGKGAESLEGSRESVPADTLFAAMLDVLYHLGGDVDTFAKPFTSQPPDPPFLHTSAFPFACRVRFFPLPVDLRRLFTSQVLDDFNWNKPLKRLRYFSEGLLRKALTGEKLDEWLFPIDEHAEPENGAALQGGTLWLTKEEIDDLPHNFHRCPGRLHSLRRLNLWRSQSVPRVTVNRISSASSIYYAQRVIFTKGCGLWFGVEWREAQIGNFSYTDAFEKILKSLSESGLGGERTAGYGGFNYQKGGDFSFSDPASGGLAYLLSRYHPKETEIAPVFKDERAAYRLEAVGGWLRTPGGAAQRRKRLWLVTEGSLLPGAPAGDVSDVRPKYQNSTGDFPHPVYRSGLAVTIGWPNTQGEEAQHG
ncbi:MAG: type III-A CRISPR-associated RAMP protein Csm4 [Chloroflexota bacterium]